MDIKETDNIVDAIYNKPLNTGIDNNIYNNKNIDNKTIDIEIKDNTDIAVKQDDKISDNIAIINGDIDNKAVADGDKGKGNIGTKENEKIIQKNERKRDKRLDNLKPIQKGEVRNPGGRPKVPDAVKEMLKAAAPKAVEALAQYIKDPDTKPEIRVKCIEIVMDRVYGKAVQPIDGLVENAIQIVFAPTVQSWGD